MAELARDAGMAASWYEPRKSAASMVAVAWELFPRLTKATRLVVGDPFSRFVQAVLALADVAEVVVVDDGTATISFIAQLTRKRKQLGMKQDDLARLIGVSDRLVDTWERCIRYPGAFSLCCWAMALSVKLTVEDS